MRPESARLDASPKACHFSRASIPCRPPETVRRGPRATKVAQILEKDRDKVPVALALTIILELAGAVYFAAFYDIGVDTELGTVANLGKMNTSIVGIIATLGTTAIYILVHMMGKKR